MWVNGFGHLDKTNLQTIKEKQNEQKICSFFVGEGPKKNIKEGNELIIRKNRKFIEKHKDQHAYYGLIAGLNVKK